MLNINAGHNSELMVSCHALWEYAEYTGRVRNYAKELPIEAAVERAVTECIREEILKSFLQKNRAEAMRMSIYEYDEERHIRQEREDARKEGELIGWQNKLKDQVKKKLEKGKSIPEIAEALEEDEGEIQKLVEELEKEKQ